MDLIKINGKHYKYAENFSQDRALRASFNQLSMSVFGFDFEDWYLNGYWGPGYIPYSLLDGETVVSNISVSLIEFEIGERKTPLLQIGTVMTATEYRNKGLSRALLDKVLAQWRGKCDLIYLFANQSVLDFYPKFGFKQVQEFQYSKSAAQNVTNSYLTKLDMTSSESNDLVLSYGNNGNTNSKFTMLNNSSLIMFYLTSIFAENVYYLEKWDVLVVLQYEADTLTLIDIFSLRPFSIDELLPYLTTPETKRIQLGFTPKDKSSYDEKILEPDDVLFVMDDRHDLCKSENFMFPLLSHA